MVMQGYVDITLFEGQALRMPTEFRLQFFFFEGLINSNRNFIFSRYSDGETEILKNTYLKLGARDALVAGKQLKQSFQPMDQKIFDPIRHQNLQAKLKDSVTCQSDGYIRGVPRSHNGPSARSYYANELGCKANIAYADLFMNSNFPLFLNLCDRIVTKKSRVLVGVGNYRLEKRAGQKMSAWFSISDSAFDDTDRYLKQFSHWYAGLPSNSLCLCSASSLANVFAYEAYGLRSDITFLDIGSALNFWLDGSVTTRDYQILGGEGLSAKLAGILYKMRKHAYGKW